MTLVGKLRSVIGRAVRPPLDYLRQFRTPSAIGRFDKLHLGAGSRHIAGWANLDLAGRDNLLWDLRRPLPLAPGKVRLVYSEHFIEHVTRDDALLLLTHARRVLADDGVVRISTPDLRKLVEDYLAGKVGSSPEAGWFPASPCQMVNGGMRLWGHTFLYDEPELRSVLVEAGFRLVERVKRGLSAIPELCGLETRPDGGDLIFEARP